MSRPCLHVGADPFPPYQYFLPDGTLTGIDYDKVKAAFDKAGYDIKVTLTTFDQIWRMLDAGEMQAAFQVQPTPEREKRAKFSKLLRNAATEVITNNKDLKIENYKAIEEMGLKMGVMEGYTNGPDLDALSDSIKRPYADTDGLLLAVSKGEVDIAIFDKGVKEYTMQQMGIKNLYAFDHLTFYRPLHVIFKDQALCDAFNAGMDQL